MHAQAQSYTVFPPQTTENVCIKLTSLSFLCSLLRTPGPWHNVNLALTVKALGRNIQFVYLKGNLPTVLNNVSCTLLKALAVQFSSVQSLSCV